MDSIKDLSMTELGKIDQDLTGIYNLSNTQLKAMLTDGIKVNIENINMPFVALVGFLVKVALASIPAAFVFMAFMFIVTTIFSTLVIGGIGSLLGN